MNSPHTPHPADLAPLSYGPGLALGLLLILGLPGEKKNEPPASAPGRPDFVRQSVNGAKPGRERHVGVAATRP